MPVALDDFDTTHFFTHLPLGKPSQIGPRIWGKWHSWLARNQVREGL